MRAVDHLHEGRVRVEKIEQAETQLALEQLNSTPQLHAELARLAQAAGRHLWIVSEEQRGRET